MNHGGAPQEHDCSLEVGPVRAKCALANCNEFGSPSPAVLSSRLLGTDSSQFKILTHRDGKPGSAKLSMST